LNLYESTVQEIAETIARRIKVGTGTWRVYARKNGTVAMDKVGDVRRSVELPESCLVGTYNRASLPVDIADDLKARRDEIGAGVAA
jgi:hypothetical protein